MANNLKGPAGRQSVRYSARGRLAGCYRGRTAVRPVLSTGPLD